MRSLYIDANLLSGEIPDCWNHWFLNYLDLANNNLTGKIPPSLLHKDLRLLNHRKNSIESVPVWIGDKLSKRMGQCLRSNNFNGHIPHNICDRQSLQNLDLAHNNISGVIPPCFRNLTAMATKAKINRREDEYETTQGLVTSMDLSANSLTGEISKEIASLIG
ncbi:hypothetical protein Golob_018529, partial [Gossypium lobatum]|nr:hypothetical protein [Gossypium lobatum]